MGVFPRGIHSESVRTMERVEKHFTQGYVSHKKVQSVTVKSALPAL